MSSRIRLAAILLWSIAGIAVARNVFAQSQHTSTARDGVSAAPKNAAVEQLPSGQLSSGGQSPESYPSGLPDGEYPQGGGPSGGCAEGYGACCEPNYDSSCSGYCIGGGRFYFTADYLNVRASFSQATAFVHEDQTTFTDTYVPLEFNFESSYRFGGGYRLCGCGEQIRFMFTRMTSSATPERALPLTNTTEDIVPYETNPEPGGVTIARANVDTKSYDIEWAKTIPLGGPCCNGCADACGDGCPNGCGAACCGRGCPAWDITWSGGVRIADVDWSRTYERHDDSDFIDKVSRPTLDFRGGGLRTGLEGRRYFGKDGWLSLYAKGDISLLFGDVKVTSTENIFDPTTPGAPTTTLVQNFKSRQIIPVTELEAGVSSQVTCHTMLTAGYLMSAWHDLGFRDESSNLIVPGTTVFEPATSYDDANILGFDGFFARLEVSY